MSYQDGIKQFQENIQLTEGKGDLLKDTMWNLNAGLANIAEGLSYDLAGIKNQLTAILERLARLESR